MINELPAATDTTDAKSRIAHNQAAVEFSGGVPESAVGLHDEVQTRLGVLPNFFRLAPEEPEITKNLWSFAKFAYLDNPLPSLFKERLFVYLSRFCAVRYCIARHVGFLAGLGRPSGDEHCPIQSVEEINRLVRRSFPRGDHLENVISRCTTCNLPVTELPLPDSEIEEAVFACASHLFLQTPDAIRSLEVLRHLLGESRLQHLTVFLTFVRTAHYWTTTHPELTFEDDIKHLLATHEPLAECLLNDPEAAACEVSQKLLGELSELRQRKEEQDEFLRVYEGLRRTEANLRDFVETATIGLHWVNGDGVILWANQAELDMLGYTREEYIGYHVAEFHADPPVIEDILCRLVRGETLREYEARLRCKDGAIRHVLINSSVLFEDGKFIHTRCFTRDVTEQKQAEEALRESEEHLQNALDAAGMGRWRANLCTGQGTRDANLNRILGLGAVKTTQPIENCFRLVHPDDKPAAMAAWQRALDTKGTYETEFRIIRDDGSKGWLREIGHFVQGCDGEADSVTGLTQDVTHQKLAEDALRESEARFRMIADNISQLAWTCDVLGNVTWYNRRWLDYTGLAFDEMKGWDWSKVQHPDHLDRVVTRIKHSAATGEPWEDTFPLRGRDGEYRWFLSRAVPIRDEQGNIACWFGTNTDIDDLKHAQEAAEAANRVKDEFLASVSHELRTPLNAILGWSHILQRSNVTEETASRGLATIARNATAQNELISDLLDISRIISGQFRFESGVVDLALVVKEAAETARPAADAKGVELQLKLDSACIVSGDSARLQQIIWNLLSNAVKFTSTGGRVKLQLQRHETNVTINLSDNGEGIDPAFLPYLFDRFRQAESTTKRKHGGLGLGLAIARHLIEAHGGTIRAASKGLGKGATFIVTFPLLNVSGGESFANRTDAIRGSADHASSSGLRGLRVLVVDDEESARELSIMSLTHSGAAVKAAASVRVALEIFEQWKPDILVSDIGMPIEDGFDLIKKVRALKPESGGTIPALALTGYASREDATRALEAGYHMHVPKPASPSELIAAVASLVTEHSEKLKSK